MPAFLRTHALQPLNGLHLLARRIIVHARSSFQISIFRQLYGAVDPVCLDYLQGLPVGTLSLGVADLLRANDLHLIPHHENHDLKPVLLGYGMTPEDELKL